MADLTTPSLARTLVGVANSIRVPYAYIGDVCAQAHLLRLLRHDTEGLSAVLRDVSKPELIAGSYHHGVGFRSPKSLGRFSGHYSTMLEHRVSIDLPAIIGAEINVVPLEYYVAMRLCSRDGSPNPYLPCLVQAAGTKIEDETIRSILKSIGRHDAFEKFKILVYDFRSQSPSGTDSSDD